MPDDLSNHFSKAAVVREFPPWDKSPLFKRRSSSTLSASLPAFYRRDRAPGDELPAPSSPPNKKTKETTRSSPAFRKTLVRPVSTGEVGTNVTAVPHRRLPHALEQTRHEGRDRCTAWQGAEGG